MGQTQSSYRLDGSSAFSSKNENTSDGLGANGEIAYKIGTKITTATVKIVQRGRPRGPEQFQTKRGDSCESKTSKSKSENHHSLSEVETNEREVDTRLKEVESDKEIHQNSQKNSPETRSLETEDVTENDATKTSDENGSEADQQNQKRLIPSS